MPSTRSTWLAALLMGIAALAHAQAPAAAKKPAPKPTVAPAVPPELCKGRAVLVFEDESISRLAMDGLLADLELMTASLGSGTEVAKKLVAGLKAAGCAVTHWEEPLVSVSVVDGKRTAFFGGDKKEEGYKAAHKLTGSELDTHDVVVWIKRASVEKSKSRRGEGLHIDYTAEAEVQARGQKKVALDGNWMYEQDDLPEGYAGITSSSDEEAARKKAVAKFGPIRKEKEAAFDTGVHQAVKTALAGLAPAK